MPEPDEYLPLSQAARRVGMTEVALRRRIRRGELRVYRDPRDLRAKLVRVQDLDEYVASRRIIPAGAQEEHMSDTAA